MALPVTRQQLIDWCLRELGDGVIQINISEEQIDDRIDEALSYFKDYHFDGVEHSFFNYKITASKLTFDSIIAGAPFKAGEVITGQTSGARAVIIDQSPDNLSIRILSNTTNSTVFTDGEFIKSDPSQITKQLAATNALFIGDLDNRYITLPDTIISIADVVPFSIGALSSGNFFDVRYQFALSNMTSFLTTDIVSYEMFKNNIALWQFVFDSKKSAHFNRKTNKLLLDLDWTTLHADMHLIIECQASIDPEAYKKVYSDLVVRKYASALLKRQWGSNLKKYGQIQLSGGVVLNGKEIYDEADTEIKELEKRVEKEFQYPIFFEVG